MVGGDISFDKTEAEEGEEIVVTVVAESGYVFDGLTSDPEVEFTEVEEGRTYRFTMPGADITISASFKRVYAIASIINMNFGFFGGINLQEGDTFEAGATVDLEIETVSSFWNQNLPYLMVYVNETVYHFESDPNKGFADSVGTVTVTFEMPAEDVNIYLVYNTGTVASETGYDVNLELPSEGIEVFGFDEGQKYTSLSLTLRRKESYRIQVFYSYDGETKNALDLALNNSAFFDKNGIGTTVPLYLTGDCTITIEAELVTEKTISYENLDKVVLTTNDGQPITSALPGDYVSFYYSPVDSESYTNGVLVEGVELTVNNGQNVAFTMPNNEVKITFDIHEAIPVTFLPNNDVLNLDTLTVQRSYYDSTPYHSGIPGGTIYLLTSAIQVADTCAVVGLKANGETIAMTTSYYGSYFQIPVPTEGTLELEILTGTYRNITVEAVDGISLYASERQAAGGLVTGSFIVQNRLQYLETIQVTDSTGRVYTDEDIDLVIDGIQFSFRMPDSDVTLKAVLKDYETIGVQIDFGEYEDLFIAEGSRSFFRTTDFQVTSYFPATSSESPAVLRAGDTINVTLNLVSSRYLVDLVVTDKDGQSTEYQATSNASFNTSTMAFVENINNITLQTDSVISFKVRENETIHATVSTIEEGTISYKVNGVDVESLTDLHKGDNITVSATPKTENKSYRITWTDGTQTSSSLTSLTFTATADFSLSFELVNTYTVSLVKDDNVNFSVTFRDPIHYTYYNLGDPVPENTQLAFSFNSYDTETVTFVVTMDDEEIYRGTIGNGVYYVPMPDNITITGNIVVTATK